MKRRVLLLCVLVWLDLWIPAAVAEASFRLERADGSSAPKGLNLPKTAVLADVHWPVYQDPPKPRPVVKVQAVAYRPTAAAGRCYTEPGTPPGYVLQRESRGNPRIWNQQGSSASGCWQFIRSTWGGYKGYVNAADAPVHIQNERAKQVWNGGRGCGHWSAC